MRAKRTEYSKIITTVIITVFSALAVGFIAFVCYEMHRQNDLSPVAYIGPSITGILVSIIGFYMWRAKAKSHTDLEWEKTKNLTSLRKEYPDAFTEGTVNVADDCEEEIGG